LKTADEPAAGGAVAVKTDASPILGLRDIGYTYSTGVMALESVTLDVFEGDIVGIVGPSGCGKSTLLSIIAGMQAPSRGEVRWGETEAAEAQRRDRRRLSLVFQKDTLLPWLTVEKNVAFGLRYLELDAKERRRRVTYLLELARLEDFRTAYPYQLSGGMRRRVAFLTGVAPLPRVLLLDEPFSALDEPSRVTIHSEVLKVIKEFGMTVLLVTHDLGEAITLCNRVCILTARPAHVAATHEIPFGYPRDVFELRGTAEYQTEYRMLWNELSLQIRRSEEVTQ